MSGVLAASCRHFSKLLLSCVFPSVAEGTRPKATPPFMAVAVVATKTRLHAAAGGLREEVPCQRPSGLPRARIWEKRVLEGSKDLVRRTQHC